MVRRSLPLVLAIGASACFVGVNDVEDDGGVGGAAGGGAGSGGAAGASGGNAGSTAGGSAGATNGGSGGAAGSGTGGATNGGTGGASGGGTGGAVNTGCGDHVLGTSSEECDDGNTMSGDGCSAECKVECSQTNEYLLPNKHCYRGVKDLASWSASEAACAAWHGHLVSISGDDEVDLTHKIADSIGTPAWIGLNDQNVEASYVWSDGTAFTTNEWEPGEPNDVVHIENCVVLAGNSLGTGYSWYDETCQSSYRAICERAAGVP